MIALFPFKYPATWATEYFGGTRRVVGNTEHVDVVRTQIAFLNRPLLLGGKLVEYFTKPDPNPAVDRFATAFRNAVRI